MINNYIIEEQMRRMAYNSCLMIQLNDLRLVFKVRDNITPRMSYVDIQHLAMWSDQYSEQREARRSYISILMNMIDHHELYCDVFLFFK
jgi:hypothetical protein